MTTEQERPTPRRRRAARPAAAPTMEDAASAEDPTTPAPVDGAGAPSIVRAIFSSPSSAPRANPVPDAERAPQAETAGAEAAPDIKPAEESEPAQPRTRRPRRAAVARTDEVRAESAPEPEADAAAGAAPDEQSPGEPRRPSRGRSRGRSAAQGGAQPVPLAEPGADVSPATPARAAQAQAQPEPEAELSDLVEAHGRIGAGQDDIHVAPATAAELAEIARSTGARSRPAAQPIVEPWLLDDEDAVALVPPDLRTEVNGEAEIGDDTEIEEVVEIGEDGLPVTRRRRRRRGRRGRGRSPAAEGDAAASAPQPATPVAPAGSAQPEAASVWTPVVPSYVVDFEPQPPPTKRRPARRPGATSAPRFSPEEQREIDAFVQQPSATAAPVEDLPAVPLTADEERELAAAKTRTPRRRGGRGRGSRTTAAPDETALRETPAFAPLPPAPVHTAATGSIEALLARQNVILDTMMERQIVLLRNIERSLIALDRRMSGAGTANASVPRTGIFVDVPNVMYAAERLGWNIDFGKLLDVLTRGRELVRASAYAPISDDPQLRLETQRFTQPFMGRGYRIVTKPLKRFADGSMKGNFDVEMAMDMLTMAERLDVVCLVSGDGDFSHLVETVQSRGVRVEVVAFSTSTSGDLRAVCDDYIDLTHHQRDIGA